MAECPMLTYPTFVDDDRDGYCGFVKKESFFSNLHYHNYYEIFLITNGTGTHLANGKCMPLQEGTIGFVRPDDRHAFETPNCQFYNVIIPTSLLNHVLDFLGTGYDYQKLLFCDIPFQRVLSPRAMGTLLGQIEQFVTAPRFNRESYNTGIRVLVTNLFGMFFYSDQAQTHSTPMPEWLITLLKDMELPENYTEGVSAMYRISRYTPEYLCRVFQSYLKQSPTEYVNSLRIIAASKKLIYTTENVIDIAHEVGFNTLSHFYHVFKRYYDHSPLKYRERHQMFTPDELH